MANLLQTYNKLEEILGDEIEPFASVQLVEEYRNYLKPQTVKIVLLAESHVFTDDLDRQIAVPEIAELPKYPNAYARFVYCLAYGEKKLTKNDHHPRGDGTPQFWKILISCTRQIASNDDFAPILKKTSYEDRLSNKIGVLKTLKDKGIWLVDTSIVALYKDGKKVRRMLDALRQSWEGHTRDIVCSSNPNHVICIGKGVADVVGADLRRKFPNKHTIVAQPNAHLTSEEHMVNYKIYSSICASQG